MNARGLLFGFTFGSLFWALILAGMAGLRSLILAAALCMLWSTAAVLVGVTETKIADAKNKRRRASDELY